MSDTTPAPAAQAAQAHPTLFDKQVWLRSIMERKGLHSSAKVLAWRLADHHNQRTGQCNPSLLTLAKGTGLSRSVVHENLNALRDAGLIDWISGNSSGSNRYILQGVEIHDRTAKPASPAPQRGKAPVLRLVPKQDPPASETVRSDGLSTVRPTGLPPVRPTGLPPVRPAGPQLSNSEPSQMNSVSSEAPGGGSGKQTASGSQKGKHTTFPADFTLTDDRIKVATSRGVSSQDVQAVFAHFREHHMAKGTRSPNWPAMWATWCRVHTLQKKASAPKQAAV